MRVSDYLWRAERLIGDAVAIQDARRSVTFRELAAEARALGAALEQRGAGEADRVAVMAKNSIPYAGLYFATAEGSMPIVPINWRLGTKEVLSIVRDSSARIVVAAPELAPVIETVLADVGDFDPPLPLGEVAPAWMAWARKHNPPMPSPSNSRGGSGEVIAVQMYTSGTTGTPRGAMLSHHSLRSMVASWLLELPLHKGRHRFLQVTPLFHVGGLLMLLANVAAGSKLVLHSEFFPDEAADALTNEGITDALFVPSMLQWLFSEGLIKRRTFPELQTIVYGAAPMPLPLLQQSMETFGCNFLQGYGLTETCGVLSVLRPGDHHWDRKGPPPSRLRSAGREVLCSRVRVVCDDGRDAKPGEVGEVVARGENLMSGYFNMPEATDAALEKGWLHTGDLATVDDESFIYIVDRKKDMIIVGGENIYPREIERVLLCHPAIADAAVLGIPHSVWGEEVLALVVRRPDSNIDAREVIQHCRSELARFKCPTKVEFRQEIPRNAAGKVVKRTLREPYWDGQERRV
jgi:acyl-CoA synthetase (AMP-forming)/AMP-acid ligase II